MILDKYGKSEDDYLDSIGELLTLDCCAAGKALQILDEALRSFPDSPRLWFRRGVLIQLKNEEPYPPITDALLCFEKAASLDPFYAKAYEGAGYFHDVISQDLGLAEMAFRKAIELGAGVRSYVGLARVLAQLRRPEEALTLLKSFAADDKEGLIREMEKEIQEGQWTPSTDP